VGERTDGSRALIIAALVLTGLCMRTAVTSVGAALDDIEDSLGTGSVGSGVITTLPVLCFCLLGALAPRIAQRTGTHRLLVVALAAMAIGVVLRAFTGSLGPFVAASVLALAGGAVSNVLMPSLVKLHFPDRIPSMTAVYTTAMAVGQTAAVGLTVPIGHLAAHPDDRWRVGLGSWAIIAVVALVPWLRTLSGDRPPPGAAVPHAGGLVRNPAAWAMAVFFGFQSFQAYVAFGWFPKFFTDHGMSDAVASALTAFYSGLSIPVAMVMPTLTARRPRTVVITLSAMLVTAYAGLLSAPRGAPWLWMLLAGIGAGLFQFFLTLTGLVTATPREAAALSAFSQGIGYLLAGTGPLLTGVLLGATHESWTWPFVLLFCAVGICFVLGLYISRPARFVPNEPVARTVP